MSGLFLCGFLGSRSADWGAVCGFGRSGRQNSVEQSVFCLLCGPQALDLVAGVDKIRYKSPYFVYFGACGRQNWSWE